jgi:hypothetical protein
MQRVRGLEPQPTTNGVATVPAFRHPAAAALAIMLLAGCADKPVIVAVDTLCVSTSRYRATDAQIAAMKADEGLWGPLVDWLRSFNIVRDGACLKPVPGT